HRLNLAVLLDVVIERPDQQVAYPLERRTDGTFGGHVAGTADGTRYWYRLDGERMLPDPASRSQPDGVHGPSAVVDGARFAWSDDRRRNLELCDLAIYELHVGTFSPEGTFAGAMTRLPLLARLGVTAIELMPIADFAGARNWGYDGVSLYAPARCYGTPDDVRRLVDAAHRLNLAVLLDVVYNHVGPDGAYLSAFSPYYFTDRHQTPWGAAVNLDGPHSEMVREFFIQNALYWIHDYHIDGLRIDATHAMADESPRHFLAELTSRVHASSSGRRPLLIAEDHRNLRSMLIPESGGGWGLDAVWADDFHHQCRRALAGDAEGYYRDFSGGTADLAETIRRGWFYVGQHSTHLGAPRGTETSGVSTLRFIICLQNHDQIGNRAQGERLHHQIESAAYRAASVLLLMAPETPLLFMGQEWAASTPFLYFTDHHSELGALVTEGRREEFRSFAAFSDPASRDAIPDPQADSTFEASRLRWHEREREPHASTLRLYVALLSLRRREPALRGDAPFHVAAVDDGTIALRRESPDGDFLVMVRLHGAGRVNLGHTWVGVGAGESTKSAAGWSIVLTSEDEAFSGDPVPIELEQTSESCFLTFGRPSAIVLRRTGEGGAAA
ncbi:MAG: malto-oligosyltrehalose trehalohydrolase, partial [Vicinamibacterales bacterium]